MTAPIDPIRPPLVERTAATRRVVRRREEAQDEQPGGQREDEPKRDETGDEGGLHIDVLA